MFNGKAIPNIVGLSAPKDDTLPVPRGESEKRFQTTWNLLITKLGPSTRLQDPIEGASVQLKTMSRRLTLLYYTIIFNYLMSL